MLGAADQAVDILPALEELGAPLDHGRPGAFGLFTQLIEGIGQRSQQPLRVALRLYLCLTCLP